MTDNYQPDPPFKQGALLAQKWPNRELRCQRWETSPWSVEWNMQRLFFLKKKTVDTVTRFHLKPCSSLTSPWLFRSIFFPPRWYLKVSGDAKTLFSYSSMFVCLLLDIIDCRVFWDVPVWNLPQLASKIHKITVQSYLKPISHISYHSGHFNHLIRHLAAWWGLADTPHYILSTSTNSHYYKWIYMMYMPIFYISNDFNISLMIYILFIPILRYYYCY